MSQAWIPIERIEAMLQLEPAILTISLAVIGWLFHRFFLKGISEERNARLTQQFHNLGLHFSIALTFYAAFYLLRHWVQAESVTLERLATYIGIISLFSGAVVFVRVLRILAFEYLYFSHMKVPFPLLLVNIFTLVLTMIMAGWISADLFNIRLAPLLATSAIFSLVLGLALQDTLGNLFAGVALQFDKPYEIGDWIEVMVSPTVKCIGQVHEISWRATVLIGLNDEAVTVPNKTMSQTQISNFSTKSRPICRSHLFRLPYGTPIEEAKKTLAMATLAIPGVRKNPAPLVLVNEASENWLAFKLTFFIDDYGAQWTINDRVLTAATNALERAGFEIAAPRLALVQEAATTELHPAS